MALLAPQGVPRILLEQKDERMTEFIRATGTLQAFSMITVDKDKTNYRMHHLVQLAMEQWLKLEGLLTSTQLEALRSVHKAYPYGEPESLQTRELLYPHAQVVTRYDMRDQSSRLTQADLLYKLALYEQKRGKFKPARQQIISALDIQEELLGPQDIQTIRSRSFLGGCYSQSGKFKLAQKILREALTKFETLVGPNHLYTLTTKMDLACSFKNDNLREVETMYREIMTALEKMEHSQTHFWLINQHNLAVNLQDQGRLKESEELYTQAVVGKQKILGPEHPSTLSSMVALSSLCKKDDEEEYRLRDALRLQEKVLGPDHPDTLYTANNLVNGLITQAKLEEAEELALPTLQKTEKALGPKHPWTLAAVAYLATIYRNQGRFALAKELFERAVQGHVEVLGPNQRKTLEVWWGYMVMPPEWRQISEQQAFNADHPVRITALDDHARKLYSQGRYPEAETPARMAVAQYEKFLGPTNKFHMRARDRLALILIKLYRFDEAEELCRLAFSMAQKALRKDDDYYLDTLNILGVIQSRQGRIKEAEEQYRKVLAPYEESGNLDHPKSLAARHNLAILLHRREQYEAAEVEFRMLVAAYKKARGFDDTETLCSVVSLIITLEIEGKYAEAEELAVSTIAAYGRIGGADHPDTATSQWVLAKILWRQGNLDEAEEMCRKTLTAPLNVLGQEHPETLDSRLLLTEILRDCGKLDEALSMGLMVAESGERVYGKESSETLSSRELVAEIAAEIEERRGGRECASLAEEDPEGSVSSSLSSPGLSITEGQEPP